MSQHPGIYFGNHPGSSRKLEGFKFGLEVPQTRQQSEIMEPNPRPPAAARFLREVLFVLMYSLLA